MIETRRIPLLHDRHNHVSLYSALSDGISLDGLDTPSALALLGGLTREKLHLALGWHAVRTPLMERDLEALPPVILVHQSLHGYLCTPAALSHLKAINPAMAANRQNQAWNEAHFGEILETFARIAGLDEEKVALFLDKMQGLGMQVLDDMQVPGPEALQLLRNSRIGHQTACWVRPDIYKSLDQSQQSEVTGIKLFTDGALGTGSAALSGGFLDGSRGKVLHSDGETAGILKECHGYGKAVAIHAIGDVAIEQVLTLLEQLKGENRAFAEVRMEHVQFITLAQARRAKTLEITLSMQPNFSSDSRDYADRLSPAQCAANNPFRMLIDQAGFKPGVDLIFGTDGMPQGVEYALQWALFPCYSGQRLSLEECIAGFGACGEPEGFLTIDHETEQVRWSRTA